MKSTSVKIIALRKNQIKFTSTLQKADEFETNATCTNIVKKSTKFNLDFGKQRGSQNTIKKLVVDDKEITDQTNILEHIREFQKTLFKKTVAKN